MSKDIHVKPIGFIRSDIIESSVKHIQLPKGNGITAEIEVLPEYQQGLKDVEGFHYIIVLFHFDQSDKEKLLSGPADHANKHGVFATRSPNRPNHIGMSVVRLIKVEGGKVYIENADMLNGTPVLDIKPFVPDIDAPESQNSGWLKNIDRSKWKK